MVYAMTRKKLFSQNPLAQMKNVEKSVLFKVGLAREITYDMRKWPRIRWASHKITFLGRGTFNGHVSPLS